MPRRTAVGKGAGGRGVAAAASDVVQGTGTVPLGRRPGTSAAQAILRGVTGRPMVTDPGEIDLAVTGAAEVGEVGMAEAEQVEADPKASSRSSG